jgi:hypothetical protein
MGYSYVYNLQTMRHSRFNLRYNVRVINEDHKLGLKNRTKTYVPFNLMLQDVTLPNSYNRNDYSIINNVSDDELDTYILIGQTYVILRLLHRFRN